MESATYVPIAALNGSIFALYLAIATSIAFKFSFKMDKKVLLTMVFHLFAMIAKLIFLALLFFESSLTTTNFLWVFLLTSYVFYLIIYSFAFEMREVYLYFEE